MVVGVFSDLKNNHNMDSINGYYGTARRYKKNINLKAIDAADKENKVKATFTVNIG